MLLICRTFVSEKLNNVKKQQKRNNMKTTIMNLKNDLTKLTTVLMIGVLLSLSLKANAQCTAGFTASSSPANNGTVNFTNTSSASNFLFYNWSFGDGSSDNTMDPVHVYNNTGTYTVCLTIYDSLGMYDSTGMLGGCYNSFCATVAIVNNNPITCYSNFSMTQDTINGNINSYSFANYSTGNSLNYFWNFGDGTSSSLENPIHSFGANGTFTVCLTVTSNVDSSCNATYCQTVTTGNPTSSCYAAFQLVSNSTNTYAATDYSTGNNLEYLWDFGDGTFSSLQNPTHAFGTIGTYSICLTVTSSIDSTCNSTSCQTITTGNPAGSCYASFQLSADSSNTNTFIASNYSSGNSLNYFWDFGDGTSSTLLNPIHTFGANGAYTVCLTVTSSVDSSCYNTYCDYLTIGNNTGSCVANFMMYLDSTNLGISTYSTYNYSTGNSLNYFWNFGDGTTSALLNPSHTFSSNGTYTVCLTVSSSLDSTCYNTYCQTLTIGGTPAGGCSASFQVMQDSINTSSFFLYLSSNNYNLIYTWDFGDGTSSTQQYPTHTYAGSGPYLICLTVSDANGCTDTYCDSLYAGRASGGLTITVVNPVVAGITDNSSLINSLENYPNPFSATTTIAYSIIQDASIELCILDLLGNKIAVIESGNKSSGIYQTDWSASNISAGIYMLQLKVNNQISTKKMMITK